MKRKTLEEYYQVNPKFIEDLYFLQVELLKLQKHIKENGLRLAILCEGRDTAGKGSAINRFTQFLNPREYRTVALLKPTELERGQWYFQRHIQQLPNAGEIVFFDRSWYTRAVVSPWIIVRASEREKSRIEAMRYVLSLIDYADKSPDLSAPNDKELFPYRPY